MDYVFIEQLCRLLKNECADLDAMEIGSGPLAGFGRGIAEGNI